MVSQYLKSPYRSQIANKGGFMVVLSILLLILAVNMSNMRSNIITTLSGVAGIGGVEVVTAAIPPDAGTITEVGGLIVQILIAIVSLFGLFKKKRN